MESIDKNLVQAMRWTKGAAQVMVQKQTPGSIINVTTIEAYRAAPGYAPYAAAKAGLANFTKTMALELAAWGIRVNSIAPDATVTPGVLKLRPTGRRRARRPTSRCVAGASRRTMWARPCSWPRTSRRG